MTRSIIPFNKPYMTGKELYYIAEAKFGNRLAGDGEFTKLCHQWLEDRHGCQKSLLTHSCTAALEMAAILLDIQEGDEVILPSYTFVSTANAFVLRGATPVFIDIRTDTLNMDEKLIEEAITPRTKAIIPVHYAGVACEMASIMEIANHHKIKVIEDAAQGIMSSYHGKALGSIGHLGAFSFHETKNLISGEGGALLINDKYMIERAEVIREKGTNRSRFFRGEVDKYTWEDIGSSFLPGELIAAFLWAQLEEATWITSQRIECWDRYHALLKPLEESGAVRRPIIPSGCKHNAHMYYVLLNPEIDRQEVLDKLRASGIYSVFHYVPLHSSPAGQKFGRTSSAMTNTDTLSQQLIRLPLWVGLSLGDQMHTVEQLSKILNNNAQASC